MWPWANSATSPSAASARAITRSARAPAFGERLAARGLATPSSRAAARGSRASSVPRRRRRRARSRSGSTSGLEAGQRARSRARAASGDASTSANSRPRAAHERARGLAAALGERDVGRRRVLARSAPLGLAVADEHDLHREYLRASASTASTWRCTGAGPACSSTTNALPSRDQVVLPADRGAAVVRQRAQRQARAARVLALDRGVGAAARGP